MQAVRNRLSGYVRLGVMAFFVVSGAWAAQAAEPALTADSIQDLTPKILDMHLTRPRLDPEHMTRLLKAFMDQLDPTHTLYLKDEAGERLNLPGDRLTGLASDIQSGRLDYFTAWLEDFRTRVLTRDAEFTAKLPERKDEITRKPKKDEGERLKFKEYPASEEARQARILYILCSDYQIFKEYLSEDESRRFALQSLQKPREKWKDLKPEAETPKLVLKALMLCLDPHSEYMDADDVEQFENNMQRSFTGIGVQIRGCPSGAQVIEVIEGGPASKSGRFDPFDQIIAVDDQVVAGQNINQIVRRIKGEKGSRVKLTLRKARKEDGSSLVENVELMRDTIDLTALRVVGKTYETSAGTVGLITVANFYQGVSGDVADRIKQLSAKQPLAGLVLDLRANSGGLLEEAVRLAGLFISQGPVVGEQDSRGTVRWLYDPDENVVFAAPVVVLVSQFSASASEIVTGALRDYGRAFVVGTSQTHGKGSVQRVMDLDGGGRMGKLKITFQQYFLPGGESVQLKGVEPDILLPGPKVIEEFLEKSFDGALPARKIAARLTDEQPDYKLWKPYHDSVLPRLKEESAKRVAANKEFDRYRKPETDDPEKDPKIESPRVPKGLKKNEKDPLAEEAAQIAGDAVVEWQKVAGK